MDYKILWRGILLIPVLIQCIVPIVRATEYVGPPSFGIPETIAIPQGPEDNPNKIILIKTLNRNDPHSYDNWQSGNGKVTPGPTNPPTGKPQQFAGFEEPNHGEQPPPQRIFGAQWAAWTHWSLCRDHEQVRARACRRLKGYKCQGQRKETRWCYVNADIPTTENGEEIYRAESNLLAYQQQNGIPTSQGSKNDSEQAGNLISRHGFIGNPGFLPPDPGTNAFIASWLQSGVGSVSRGGFGSLDSEEYFDPSLGAGNPCCLQATPNFVEYIEPSVNPCCRDNANLGGFYTYGNGLTNNLYGDYTQLSSFGAQPPGLQIQPNGDHPIIDTTIIAPKNPLHEDHQIRSAAVEALKNAGFKPITVPVAVPVAIKHPVPVPVPVSVPNSAAYYSETNEVPVSYPADSNWLAQSSAIAASPTTYPNNAVTYQASSPAIPVPLVQPPGFQQVQAQSRGQFELMRPEDYKNEVFYSSSYESPRTVQPWTNQQELFGPYSQGPSEISSATQQAIDEVHAISVEDPYIDTHYPSSGENIDQEKLKPKMDNFANAVFQSGSYGNYPLPNLQVEVIPAPPTSPSPIVITTTPLPHTTTTTSPTTTTTTPATTTTSTTPQTTTTYISNPQSPSMSPIDANIESRTRTEDQNQQNSGYGAYPGPEFLAGDKQAQNSNYQTNWNRRGNTARRPQPRRWRNRFDYPEYEDQNYRDPDYFDYAPARRERSPSEAYGPREPRRQRYNRGQRRWSSRETYRRKAHERSSISESPGRRARPEPTHPEWNWDRRASVRRTDDPRPIHNGEYSYRPVKERATQASNGQDWGRSKENRAPVRERATQNWNGHDWERNSDTNQQENYGVTDSGYKDDIPKVKEPANWEEKYDTAGTRELAAGNRNSNFGQGYASQPAPQDWQYASYTEEKSVEQDSWPYVTNPPKYHQVQEYRSLSEPATRPVDYLINDYSNEAVNQENEFNTGDYIDRVSHPSTTGSKPLDYFRSREIDEIEYNKEPLNHFSNGVVNVENELNNDEYFEKISVPASSGSKPVDYYGSRKSKEIQYNSEPLNQFSHETVSDDTELNTVEYFEKVSIPGSPASKPLDYYDSRKSKEVEWNTEPLNAALEANYWKQAADGSREALNIAQSIDSADSVEAANFYNQNDGYEVTILVNNPQAQPPSFHSPRNSHSVQLVPPILHATAPAPAWDRVNHQPRNSGLDVIGTDIPGFGVPGFDASGYSVDTPLSPAPLLYSPGVLPQIQFSAPDVQTTGKSPNTGLPAEANIQQIQSSAETLGPVPTPPILPNSQYPIYHPYPSVDSINREIRKQALLSGANFNDSVLHQGLYTNPFLGQPTDFTSLVNPFLQLATQIGPQVQASAPSAPSPNTQGQLSGIPHESQPQVVNLPQNYPQSLYFPYPLPPPPDGTESQFSYPLESVQEGPANPANAVAAPPAPTEFKLQTPMIDSVTIDDTHIDSFDTAVDDTHIDSINTAVDFDLPPLAARAPPSTKPTSPGTKPADYDRVIEGEDISEIREQASAPSVTWNENFISGESIDQPQEEAEWSSWASWGKCRCGQQSRTRKCAFKDPYLTSGCLGISYEVRACTGGLCPTRQMQPREPVVDKSFAENLTNRKTQDDSTSAAIERIEDQNESDESTEEFAASIKSQFPPDLGFVPPSRADSSTPSIRSFHSPWIQSQSLVTGQQLSPVVHHFDGICRLPLNRGGTCDNKSSSAVWYFDTLIHRCKAFIFGGCGGNANRFENELDCKRVCGHLTDSKAISPEQRRRRRRNF